MDTNSQFYAQVQLLVRVLPFVAKEQCFALKGGTAINLFVRDLPRLSVDILSSQTKCNTLLRCWRYGKNIQTVLAGRTM